MGSIQYTVTITDFRQDAAKVLDWVKRSKKPIIVNHRGRAAAVMLSMERYEAQEREWAIVLRIARGEQEIADGKGHGLRAVMKDADRILNRI
jgi:prevent-host-death family protein